MTVNLDAYSKVILTILTVLLLATVVALWWDAPDLTPTAQAQGIPDAGAQRERMIQELQGVQTEIRNLAQLLRSGQVRVTIAPEPEQTPTPTETPRRRSNPEAQ